MCTRCTYRYQKSMNQGRTEEASVWFISASGKLPQVCSWLYIGLKGRAYPLTMLLSSLPTLLILIIICQKVIIIKRGLNYVILIISVSSGSPSAMEFAKFYVFLLSIYSFSEHFGERIHINCYRHRQTSRHIKSL